MAAVVGMFAGALLTVLVMQAGAVVSATNAAVERTAGRTGTDEVGEEAPAATGEPTVCPKHRDTTLAEERRAHEATLPRRQYAPPLVNMYTRPVVDYRFPNKIEQGGFRRVGTLSGQVDGQTQVLPLFSRPTIYPGRYHYHSTTKGFDGEPVGVHFQGRDCLSDMGCSEIYGNEDEPVEMPNLCAAPFRATIFS